MVSGVGGLRTAEVEALDPYAFFALLGKKVIHPGGRRSTREMFFAGGFASGQAVLDVGCGVGWTAIELARRFGVEVDAVDISDLMLACASLAVAGHGLEDRVRVKQGDILQLAFPDDHFDRVVEEAVTMFVDGRRAATELVRVCRPGGLVLATEFVWLKPPSAEAEDAFLRQVCSGMQVRDRQGWVDLYQAAGLAEIQVTTGPFEMMTPAGFLSDEGFANAMAFVWRTLSRPVHARKMAWLMPRIAKAVPFLGYILLVGRKP